MEVKIPAGVETGSRLRVSGEGEAGTQGGASGDLYVVIHVAEHEQFERQGSNLYEAVPITFAQAALGAEIMVKTLDDEEKLKVPMGTQTGTVFRLARQGNACSGWTRSRRPLCFSDCHHSHDVDERTASPARAVGRSREQGSREQRVGR